MSAKYPAWNEAAGFMAFAGEVRPRMDCALKKHLPFVSMHGNFLFNEALYDPVFPGGRRMRPILALLAAELVHAHDNVTLAMEHGGKIARERAAHLAAEAQYHLIAKFGDLPPAQRLCEFARFLS
jgi:hypothetical protein